MRRLLGLLGLACISLSTLAQNTIPGTFSQQTGQNKTVVGGYVVAPPSISLGNGLSPTVITTMSTVEIAGTQPAVAVETFNSIGNSDLDTIPLKPFDFVVADKNSDALSLGEVAASLRRSSVQVGKVYTNEDLTVPKRSDTMDNLNAGNSNTGGITGTQPTEQASAQGNENRGVTESSSPFWPPPQIAQSMNREVAQISTPTDQSAQATENNGNKGGTLPHTASPLPLLALLGLFVIICSFILKTRAN